MNETSPAPQQPQPATPDPRTETLEALAWCEQQGARITFHRDEGRPCCTIEVLAPGSTWNLLRTRGPDFLGAIGAARGQWAALGRTRGAA